MKSSPIIQRALPLSSPVPVRRLDGPLGRLARNAIFRFANQPTIFFKLADRVYRCLTFGYQKLDQLDLERLERTKQSFVTIGTQFERRAVTEAEILLLHCDGPALREKIEREGGRWTQITVSGQKVFAILPPEKASPEWNLLYAALKDVFEDFGGEQIADDGRMVLVTAREPKGDLEERLQKNVCVLFTNQAQPWQFRKSRLACFLGRGFTVAAYDGRGIHSDTEYASLEGSYEDAEVAYLNLKERYPNLYLYGHCKDSFSAMSVSQKYSVDAIFETPPRSFFDVVKNLWFLRWLTWLAQWCIRAAHAPTGSRLHQRYPEEALGDHRGILKMEPVEKKPYTRIFLANEGDRLAPPSQVDEIATECKKLDQCHVTSIRVDTKPYSFNPHDLQSWSDMATMHQLEDLIFQSWSDAKAASPIRGA